MHLPLYLQSLIAMVAGVGAAFLFPGVAQFGGPLSTLIIQLVKAIATLLLFFAIVDSILKAQFRGKDVGKLGVICTINAVFAIGIGLTLIHLFHPGIYLRELVSSVSTAATQPIKDFDWMEAMRGWIPNSLAGPFLTNSVPAVILIAIAFGLAARKVLKESGDRQLSQRVQEVAELCFLSTVTVIEWVVHLVPLAIFASVAKVVSMHGFSGFKGLAAYLIVCSAGMGIHILFVYQGWIRMVAGISLTRFWKNAQEPAIYAFGVNSSLATIPVTLKRLARLGVSPASARLSTCVGTNFNNDGILLYEVVAALFIAQAYGIHLSLGQQLGIALLSVVTTIGVGGIPEAGLISLSLVLSTAGLPSESLPILLTADWLIARLRSVTNVLGDMTVAIALDGTTRR